MQLRYDYRLYPAPGHRQAFARAFGCAEQSIPFGRISEPEEVAALVTFLASPLASFISGAHIPVDGAQRKAIMDQ